MTEPPYLPISAPVPRATPSRVQIIDVDMPFASMVGFMIKWALASIPALIILFCIVGFGVAVLGGIGAAMFHR